MIPGALAAMATVLLSGRDDWHRRIVYFAMFRRLGWSFGGSISYMQVVAYTHSGRFGKRALRICLPVRDRLSLGGTGRRGTALCRPSSISRFLTRCSCRWVSSSRSGGCKAWRSSHGSGSTGSTCSGTTPTGWRRHWRLLGVFMCEEFVGRLDPAASLVLYLAAGWWAGFLVLVLVLRLHMTPPRGDNWAGCLGMTAGFFWYCRQTGHRELGRAALYCGFIGGIGFAAASMLKLVEVTSGYQTNWHSVLEQTTGLFNGIGVAVAVAALARRHCPARWRRRDSPLDRTARTGLRLDRNLVLEFAKKRGAMGRDQINARGNGRIIERYLVRPGVPGPGRDFPCAGDAPSANAAGRDPGELAR